MKTKTEINSEAVPSHLFGTLPILKLTFHITIPDSALLPAYTGSAWRGLIGWEIKYLICPFDKKPDCRECLIHSHCPYFLLFEESSSFPGLSETPRGYIFYPPIASNDQNAALHVTLIGGCVRFAPVIVQAVFNGQKSGLGAGRHPYTVLSWEQQLPDGSVLPMPLNTETSVSLKSPAPLKDWIDNIRPAISNPLSVKLTTPVRLRKKGRYLNQMDWKFFFASIARRLESLHVVFNNGKPMGKLLWENVQKSFDLIVCVNSNLNWYDYARYSNRQKTTVPMGGYIGEAVFEASDSLTLTEWLSAATIVHVGKGASMGLGKIDIKL